MPKKRYVSLTGIEYTFPVKVKEKAVWVSFKGTENDFVTSDKGVQGAIEASENFKSGKIGLSGSKGEGVTPQNPGSTIETVEFPEVTDINGAAAVLKAEPYKIHHFKLKSPESIKEQSALVGVSFPNLVL